MRLNKNRYFQLLQKNDMLKNQNISLLYDNPPEYCELVEYKRLVQGEMYYSNKSNYIQLIEKYLNQINQSIDKDATRRFMSKFCDIFQEDNKKLLEIENQILKDGRKRLDELAIHPNSICFSEKT
jgi:hypothetical protein